MVYDFRINKALSGRNTLEITLYKIWTKENDSTPWTFNSVSTEDTENIVKPYNILVENQPGYISSQFRNLRKIYMRTFVLDSIENAKHLYNVLNDETIPVVKALKDMTDRYCTKLGVQYTTTWKLTQTVEK